ncbi:transcriptional corepressor LEUNIG-like [Abrus precatorius]|uniref:Transcriptional corepressor LEUNIG-like n=1 Tax=Abrus precatorius TaxID=3816 RepID=A0A8B8K4X0_ABRPR|nr:transcriptional corepressor LEUNIG-like [Abrus precatorius]
MASSPDNNLEWDADKILQLYLHDYMIKKGMHSAAKIFKKEAHVPNNPVDMKFLDSVIDSPDGFLHEWWSIFYDVFTSRQGEDKETGSGSSSKVPDASNDASPRIPQIPMNEPRSSKQFQVSSNFNNMMPQPAICLIPSIIYPSQDVSKQNQKQVAKESGIGMCVRRDTLLDPRDVMQKMTSPLEGPHEKKINERLNLVPLSGWPINVGDGVLTSLSQSPNYQQQCHVLKTQNQNTFLAQALACTPKNQTFAVLGNPTNFNSQYMMIPKIESSDKDKQMINQMTNTVEHQHQRGQQIQSQIPNAEKNKKGKTSVSLRPGESAQNYADEADGKPEDENVESFLSFENENADHRTAPFSNLKRISTTCKIENKGFSFEEVGCLHSSKSKVLSSHFSSDGKVLASAGHDKKVFLWNMETFDCATTTEAHSLLVTDVRFKPGSTIFATSSFDRSVRLWDAAKPTKSMFKLTGHAEQVMSLDFHPRKVDLLCSCDSNDVIRLWNVNQCVCMHVTKGGSKQVRFQPFFGKYLATASTNNIKVIDIETNSLLFNLKGHVKDVISICWDKGGNYIASVSEDSARVWSVASDGKCISELHSNGNKFQSCIFHPGYLNLLVIGGYQSLELWSPTESSKTWAVPAHKGLIAGLADSPKEELIASASHDHCVKLWK